MVLKLILSTQYTSIIVCIIMLKLILSTQCVDNINLSTIKIAIIICIILILCCIVYIINFVNRILIKGCF